MEILILSPYPETLAEIVTTGGDHVTACEAPITADDPAPAAFDLAISFGYRHLIRDAALEAWRDRLINLHVSLLPWNRGADPNFWAAHDGTPGGVSIHYIDEGIDTGDLIAQREVPFEAGDTLATSYARLQAQMLDLFAQTWPAIRAGTAPRHRQAGAGTHHRARDKDALMAKLPRGWETPVEDVASLARPTNRGQVT